MKLESVKRASEIGREIDNTAKQLENAKSILQGGHGVVIAEYGDLSGKHVDYIYENGQYPESLYSNIMQCVVTELEKHLEKLHQEVKEL